jgi:hypothetical protein
MSTTPLTAQQALDTLKRHSGLQPRLFESQELLIQTFAPGSVGGTPGVAVVGMHPGFDWDKGRFLLQPAQPLTTLTPEDVCAVRESVQKSQSWHAYKAWEKQQKRIEQLQAALKGVTQAQDLGAANLIAVTALQGGA